MSMKITIPKQMRVVGSFSVSAKTGVNPESGSRSGWLGPDVSLGEGRYKLISKTTVAIVNDREPHPQTMLPRTVTKTTDFEID